LLFTIGWSGWLLFFVLVLAPPVLRIRDVYPGSRILHPKTATKERGEKNLLSYLFM
jgi:hypothetical protein